MQRPSFIPVPTMLFILLFITIIATAVFTSLSLLFYYCYFHQTVTTDKLLRARLLSGAAELTTHLLRLISIWLPLCQINNWVLLPSKTVAIPYTCGLSGTPREGMMNTAASFPLVRNQCLIDQ